jgi:hypothetical protein
LFQQKVAKNVAISFKEITISFQKLPNYQKMAQSAAILPWRNVLDSETLRIFSQPLHFDQRVWKISVLKKNGTAASRI